MTVQRDMLQGVVRAPMRKGKERMGMWNPEDEEIGPKDFEAFDDPDDEEEPNPAIEEEEEVGEFVDDSYDETTDQAHRKFLKLLRADLDVAARALKANEIRYIVDLFYQQQEDRKRTKNWVRAAREGPEAPEPNALVDWLAAEHAGIENMIKHAMAIFTDGQRVTRWAKGLPGIAEVLAAGFFSHIDITRAPTAGSLWRLGGVDPSIRWLGKDGAEKVVGRFVKRGTRIEDAIPAIAEETKYKMDYILRMATTTPSGEKQDLTRSSLVKALSRRPWNARFKTLIWRFADGQKKLSLRETKKGRSYYGGLYQEEKAKLVRRNEEGGFAKNAEQKLATTDIKKKEVRDVYKSGKLPKGHLDMMALRYIGKRFLAHWHKVHFFCEFGKESPKPYILTQPGHVHEDVPPNWPCD